jgi:hypothetical protein
MIRHTKAPSDEPIRPATAAIYKIHEFVETAPYDANITRRVFTDELGEVLFVILEVRGKPLKLTWSTRVRLLARRIVRLVQRARSI